MGAKCVAVGLGLVLVSGAAAAQRIVLFEDDYFRGQQLVIEEAQSDLRGWRWNDKASSLRVESGEWEICRDSGFRGCVRVGEGAIPRLGEGLRMNDEISSVRPVGYGDGGGQGQPGAIASGQGWGVHLSDADPLLVQTVEVELGRRGDFTLDTSGEGRNRVAGTWRSTANGVAELEVTSFNGARASARGTLEYNGDRVRRVVVDGGVWRISFTAGRGAASQVSGNVITCESQDRGFTFCPVDTQGAVTIERRLGGSNCTYNRTWSWTRDGIWVDNGCRGEFRVGRGGGGRLR